MQFNKVVTADVVRPVPKWGAPSRHACVRGTGDIDLETSEESTEPGPSSRPNTLSVSDCLLKASLRQSDSCMQVVISDTVMCKFLMLYKQNIFQKMGLQLLTCFKIRSTQY
jgi:hypothetical protein